MKNHENKEIKNLIKEKVLTLFDLPKDLLFDVPRITVVGFEDLLLENYKGIIEYEANRIRIKTNIGNLNIIGESLIIIELSKENILIKGKINIIEIIK